MVLPVEGYETRRRRTVMLGLRGVAVRRGFNPFCLRDKLAGDGQNRYQWLLERHLDPSSPIAATGDELIYELLEL